MPIDTYSPISPLASREAAEAYVAMICFKHGPPRKVGVELEWTVHHRHDPGRRLDPAHLAAAFGVHAPHTLAPNSPQDPLPHGSLITVEPGGQVEISSPPHTSVADLLAAVDQDLVALDDLLDRAQLSRGDQAADPHREPFRIVDAPRYAAMETAFGRLGPHGSVMMCSTASTQVCLDAGEPADVASRWTALHSIGPAMVALFANSPRLAGDDTGWASTRLRSTLGTCPPFTAPPAHFDDPAGAWATLAMEAPVLCVRRDASCWDSPVGLTFGDWVEGAHRAATSFRRPTQDDLDYHLSTLFPPVRPRGYLEVRYLDSQPADTWRHPSLLLSALMSAPATVDAAIDVSEQAAGRWLTAARHGLEDETVLEVASGLVELGCAAFSNLDVDQTTIDRTTDDLERRIRDHSLRRHSA